MLRVYLMLKAQYMKTAMEYTFNFWMMAIAGVIMRTLMMGVAYVLFQNMPVVAGFSEGEVYLMMAFMFISEGLSNLFFDGIWHIPGLVFQGGLDVLLTRPVSPLFQILSYEIGLQGVGVLAMGVVSLVLAVNSLGMLTAFSLPLCALFILCGTLIRVSMYLIGACSAFFMKADGHTNIPFLMYSVGEYAKYPVNLYPGFVQAILFTVIPFAFIGYVPVRILRGEHAPPLTALLLAMAALYALLARHIFYRGIGRYESMGM